MVWFYMTSFSKFIGVFFMLSGSAVSPVWGGTILSLAQTTYYVLYIAVAVM